MKTLKNVTGENLVVGSFSEELASNKLSFQDFQQRLATLDFNDAEALQKETARCSNRCNGNDVDVELKTIQTLEAMDPRVGDVAQSFRLQFRIEN